LFFTFCHSCMANSMPYRAMMGRNTGHINQ
jgi:hypothetical protein